MGIGSGIAKTIKGLSVGHVIGGGMTALSIGMSMKQGDSFGKAAMKEAGNTALMVAAPHVFWGMMAGQVAGAIGTGVYSRYEQGRQFQRENSKIQPNFRYVDTEAAYTMRSAAVQAIQGSKMNARSALGGEAKLLSRRERYNSL